MSTEKNKQKVKDGGSAFPYKYELTERDFHRFVERVYHGEGMTLRDYFAGQALAGSIVGLGNECASEMTAKQLASEAYLIADAMIAEKERINEPD